MKDMKRVWQALIFMFFWFAFEFHVTEAQDDTQGTNVADRLKVQEICNGIFLSYDFSSRTKKERKKILDRRMLQYKLGLSMPQLL